jgi:carboxymethylenebutenolidase
MTMTLNASQRYLIGELVEDYRDRQLSRRVVLQRALGLAGGVAATAHALRELGLTSQGVAAAAPITVRATVAPAALRAARVGEPGARTAPPPMISRDPVVAPNDPAIVAAMVEFPGEAGPVLGYLARPARAGAFPALIVNHDNVGVAEPMLDITRRFAKEGYVALLVDLNSRGGGTAAVVAQGMSPLALAGRLSDDERAADLLAGLAYLQAQPFVAAARGFGTVGFCFGGNQTWLLATRSREIRAAVPYYGTVEVSSLPAVTGAVLAFYGEDDTRVTAQAPEVIAALEAAGTPVDSVIYPGAGHAFFFNFDERYRPEAAADSWRRTHAWLAQYLSA